MRVVSKMEAEKSVLPGAFLGTEEEYAAGAGTFTDSSGNIIATVAGDVSVGKDKTVSVKRKGGIPHKLKKGELVFARVEAIYEPVALLQVEPQEAAEGRQNPTDGYSVIHASRVKAGYVEEIHDEMRVGDVVKASVEDIRPDGEVGLSTKAMGLGVVKAYCSRCRAPLALSGAKLQCGRCGSVERRHLSKDYVVRR